MTSAVGEDTTPPGWSDIVDAFRSVVPAKGGVYVAGPLNSGPRLYSGRAGHVTAVREANDRDMRAFVTKLRSASFGPVIDSSRLRPRGWSDRAIGDLFLTILSEFVREAWFMDGWEYSRGATKEFLHCLRFGIPCRLADGHPLSLRDGLDRQAQAVADIEARGFDAMPLRARLASIVALRDGEAVPSP